MDLMAHTLLIYCHIRPFAHAEPFPLKTKTKENFFFFSSVAPFRPFTFGLCSQTCSGQKKEQKNLKITRTGRFRGLQG